MGKKDLEFKKLYKREAEWLGCDIIDCEYWAHAECAESWPQKERQLFKHALATGNSSNITGRKHGCPQVTTPTEPSTLSSSARAPKINSTAL